MFYFPRKIVYADEKNKVCKKGIFLVYTERVVYSEKKKKEEQRETKKEQREKHQKTKNPLTSFVSTAALRISTGGCG